MENNIHAVNGSAEKTPVHSHRKAARKASVLWAAVASFVITLVVMTLFEVMKQILKPSITIWQSHTITIVFTSCIVFLLSLMVLKEFKWRMIEEMEYRHAA